MEQEIEIDVLVARPEHEKYVDTILETIAEAAKVRGTGIAKRTHEYLAKKMQEAKAVIALTKGGQFSWTARCKAHQRHDLYAGKNALASCQDLLAD